MELKSERREEEIIKPRFEAIYLIRMFTPWSLPRIGRFFGNRDHTSIIYAVSRHKAYLAGKEYRIYPVATKRGARVPIDQDDRENILKRRAAGEPLKQIALEMGRAVSTVQGVIAKAQSREIEKSDHVNCAGN
jgi:hypothetical protein